MATLASAARLLSMLRMNSKGGQVSTLAVECLLHIATEPRSLEELCSLTGANNGTISRALTTMTPKWDSKGEVIQMPHLHLLTRKKSTCSGVGRPKHRVYLSKGGEELLKQAGIT